MLSNKNPRDYDFIVVLLKQEVERLRGIIFDQVGDVRPIVKRR